MYNLRYAEQHELERTVRPPETEKVVAQGSFIPKGIGLSRAEFQTESHAFRVPQLRTKLFRSSSCSREIHADLQPFVAQHRGSFQLEMCATDGVSMVNEGPLHLEHVSGDPHGQQPDGHEAGGTQVEPYLFESFERVPKGRWQRACCILSTFYGL